MNLVKAIFFGEIAPLSQAKFLLQHTREEIAQRRLPPSLSVRQDVKIASFLSVGFLANLGSSISVRGLVRLGSSLSIANELIGGKLRVAGVADFGSAASLFVGSRFSVSDKALVGSSLAIR